MRRWHAIQASDGLLAASVRPVTVFIETDHFSYFSRQKHAKRGLARTRRLSGWAAPDWQNLVPEPERGHILTRARNHGSLPLATREDDAKD